MSDAEPIRVLVVDDHPMWRDGVARDLAESGFTVVGTAGDGEQALRVAAATRPQVVLLDLNLPVRLADRGAVASLMLPACYVAVPYLLGVLGARASVRAGDLLLLAGLYAGFIGRILLKDFRDVRGDAMFGKRTFLVRHGRRWTCAFSACCWTAGAVLLVVAVHRPTALTAVHAGCLVLALGLIRALATDGGVRRDERLISAIAIVGRGVILTLFAHLSMLHAHVPVAVYDVVIGVLATTVVCQAAVMARRGPALRRRRGAAPGWWSDGDAFRLRAYVDEFELHQVGEGAQVGDAVAGAEGPVVGDAGRAPGVGPLPRVDAEVDA